MKTLSLILVLVMLTGCASFWEPLPPEQRPDPMSMYLLMDSMQPYYLPPPQPPVILPPLQSPLYPVAPWQHYMMMDQYNQLNDLLLFQHLSR